MTLRSYALQCLVFAQRDRGNQETCQPVCGPRFEPASKIRKNITKHRIAKFISCLECGCHGYLSIILNISAVQTFIGRLTCCHSCPYFYSFQTPGRKKSNHLSFLFCFVFSINHSTVLMRHRNQFRANELEFLLYMVASFNCF